MTTWVIIPIKASADSKSRLAGVLEASARATLVDAMLARGLAAATGARNVTHVALLGTSRGALPSGVTVLDEPGGGLNAAVTHALALVGNRDATRVIFIHADLPLVTELDLELLAAAPSGKILIAPDRHGTGTNAISLPLPEAKGFSFFFGPDSFAQHNAEAQRLGLKIGEVHSPGLAKDVDEPEDLLDAEKLLGPAT